MLGELVAGMMLGGLALVGLTFIEGWRHREMLDIAAEIGVILLLFEVGLESHPG